ncbi:MAG: hypothetical protein KBH06_04650 [Spirochaetes bacterium]|nr:hypothetical protein [Spirochaetota bacterium]
MKKKALENTKSIYHEMLPVIKYAFEVENAKAFEDGAQEFLNYYENAGQAMMTEFIINNDIKRIIYNLHLSTEVNDETRAVMLHALHGLSINSDMGRNSFIEEINNHLYVEDHEDYDPEDYSEVVVPITSTLCLRYDYANKTNKMCTMMVFT